MKTSSLFALALTLTTLSSAHAGSFTYPVLNQYQAQAEVLIDQTRNAHDLAARQVVQAGTEELIQLGVTIMNLYAEKNPACAVQFASFIQDIPVMETMGFYEANQKYHLGVGLPAAPNYCHMIRALVIHPVLNQIRLTTLWGDGTREENIADFEEVIEHLNNAQAGLDHPNR